MAIQLKIALPELAEELRQLLKAAGETELAQTGDGLHIVDRCHCGDDFCATFYTQPKPQGAYGTGHRNIDLESENGMIILDVVNETIACVEVLYRDEVRNALLSLLPT
jgi:hypothetical protein